MESAKPALDQEEGERAGGEPVELAEEVVPLPAGPDDRLELGKAPLGLDERPPRDPVVGAVEPASPDKEGVVLPLDEEAGRKR